MRSMLRGLMPSSHSHFTSAFHRRFGINPSEFLRWKSSKLIAVMKKIGAVKVGAMNAA